MNIINAFFSKKERKEDMNNTSGQVKYLSNPINFVIKFHADASCQKN